MNQCSFIVDYIGEFQEYTRYNRGLSSRTVDGYVRVVRLLCEFAEESDPTRISATQLRGFSGIYLHKKGVAPRSRRFYVAALHTFYKWLSARAGIDNPAAGLPYPRFGAPLPVYCEPTSVEKLIMARGIDTFTGLRDTLIIYFLACGLRVSAVTRLNESDLLFERGANGSETLTVRIHTKGDREAYVPMPEEVWVLARAYLGALQGQTVDRNCGDGKRVLFPATRRRQQKIEDWHGESVRLHRCSINLMIVSAGTKLGLPRDQLHPHALRHYFGVALARADISTITRMKLMAHASPAASAIYDHMSAHDARRAVEKANPFAGMITPGQELLKLVHKTQGKKNPRHE